MKTQGKRQCHKCPYTAAIAAGLFRDVPFSQLPCVSCTMEDLPIPGVPPDPADTYLDAEREDARCEM